MIAGRLTDKVVIITGGTSGIGKDASLLLAHEGAKVVIGARNERSGDSVVETIKQDGRGDALFVKTDVAQPEDVERLVNRTLEHFGRVDVLYSNSGMFPTGTAPQTSIETWQRCIDVNLGGQFYLAKYGIPALMQSNGGVIIFTASELGTVGISEGVAYCAAKGGVLNMTRAVAIDCAPYGIRVNCLAPGPVETPMLRNWINESANPAETEQAQTRPVLLKRFGRAEEIAAVALFLASDASSFMTGSVVVVDGGATAWYGL
jgi:NAD(P)-dependent dehydrogenase (short-subunit alcohol dehydrogenase family)